MISNPADFKEWLSGKCSCDDPPFWATRISQGGVAIVPGWKFIAIIATMFFFMTGVAGFGFWEASTQKDVILIRIGGMLITGFVGLLAFGALGAGLVVAVIDHLKGPYFIYSASRQSFSLPRQQLVASRANVLGWRLVSGNWIGFEGAQKFQDYPISELQLIVETPAGPVAFVVAGAGAFSAYSTDDKFHQIADATKLPLEIVKQHQGVTSKPVSKRVQGWRAGGM